MGKYGSLQRVISSHVREEQRNGGPGFGPLYFFVSLLILILVGIGFSEHKKHRNSVENPNQEATK